MLAALYARLREEVTAFCTKNNFPSCPVCFSPLLTVRGETAGRTWEFFRCLSCQAAFASVNGHLGGNIETARLLPGPGSKKITGVIP